MDKTSSTNLRNYKKIFEKRQLTSLIGTFISLAAFLTIVFLTIPTFFTNFWLIFPLVAVLMYARAHGTWTAYALLCETKQELDDFFNEVEKTVSNDLEMTQK